MRGKEVPVSTSGSRKKPVSHRMRKGRATTSGPQEPTHGKNLSLQREVKGL
jgi:hypothetical protein